MERERLPAASPLWLGFGRCRRLQRLQLQDVNEEEESDAQEKQPEENPVVLREEQPRLPELHWRPLGPGEKVTRDTCLPGRESKPHLQPSWG